MRVGGEKVKRLRSFSALLVLTVLSLVLTGCGDPQRSVLNPAGPVAQMQYDLIMLSLYIMLIVIVAVFAILVYVLIRFRQRPGDEHIPKQVVGNHYLEAIWIIIPVILLVILAVPTVTTTFTLAEKYPESTLEDEELLESDAGLRVNVTAYQYWWEFEYPDHDIVTAQELYIPVGEKVYFEIDSPDVIHSFWVPSLGGKKDANPGLTNTLWLKADIAGTYDGKCAELCGPGHALMDFKVKAVDPADFDQWVANMQDFDEEATVATSNAEQGREIFETQGCIGCHATDGSGSTGMAPNLAGFGDRDLVAGFRELNEENLAQWIRDPDSVKLGAGDSSAGTFMPGYDLDDEEMSALVEYLQGLKFDN